MIFTKKRQRIQKKIKPTKNSIRRRNQSKKSTRKNYKKYKGGNTNDSSFLQCYESNLIKIQAAIEKFSGQHSIDNDIAEQFINNQISIARKNAAKDLIENTTYITLEEISNIIEQLIIKLYTENEEILRTSEKIYFYVGKETKSFYFISILALYYIKKHGYKEPTNFITDYHLATNIHILDEIADSPFIMMDDVAYSGEQLSQMLYKIYYDTKDKKIPNVFVLITALNHFSLKKINRVPRDKFRKTFLNFTESPFKIIYLPDRLYTPLIIKLGIERYFNINLFFSPYTDYTPYISTYLDHKIATEASTYKNALIYGPIVPSNYNYRKLLDDMDVYKIYNDEIIEDEVLIKLLKDFFNDHDDTAMKFINSNEFKNNIRSNSNVTRINSLIKTKLLENLKITDIIDEPETKTIIEFRPFIHTCNTGEQLLNNINNPEIQNCDYRLFLVPKDCLEKQLDECVINMDVIYVLEDIIAKITKEKAIEISNKINSIDCPISWYKSGEFKMVC